jgi:hypothetical protein
MNYTYTPGSDACNDMLDDYQLQLLEQMSYVYTHNMHTTGLGAAYNAQTYP